MPRGVSVIGAVGPRAVGAPARGPPRAEEAGTPAGADHAAIVCRYYGTPEGCLRGNRCRWAHVLGPLAEDSADDARLDALMTGEAYWGEEAAHQVSAEAQAAEPPAGGMADGSGGSDTPVLKEEEAPDEPDERDRVHGSGGALDRTDARLAPPAPRGSAAQAQDRSRSPGSAGWDWARWGAGGPVPARLCGQFNSPHGCLRGESCRFLHELPSAGTAVLGQPTREGQTGRPRPAANARARGTMRAMEELVQGLGGFSTDEIQFLRSALGTELRRRQLAHTAGSAGARASR